MNTSSLVFAGIAPHPPIMVPEVGREAIKEVRASIDAMREFTERVIESGAETIVVISPHAPLDARAFVAYKDAELYGDFANFRAPDARVEVPLDEEMLNAISREAASEGYEILGIRGYDLDHGTTVPLYFLQRNGWQGRVVALGYSFLSNEDHLRFGSCITRAASEVGRRIAFVASGDLSHRLKPEAPAGYNPNAYLFDQEVVEAIRESEPERIINIDQDLRKMAGECGYRSMLVALGVAGETACDCEVLNYEAPFGVGYLVAQIARENDSGENKKSAQDEVDKKVTERQGVNALTALARLAVETFVRERRVIEKPSSEDPMLKERAACFVSIKTGEGNLRGCIGTIEPARETLADEIITNAINSATRDPRFPPVRPMELSHLRYSVDVLSAPEPAKFEELDPKVYGVIVEDESGRHRGLLLPDLQGVETAHQQVDIAARKAGIAPQTPLKLFRFRVERFREIGAD
ncbi:MAG TPA: AmmeMemoRadiSam system protein A [Pyrinomonadaceae bacterium]|nr:AmmeMemoRadiSam system protein A [Pyrinomonadaceae bacterium]